MVWFFQVVEFHRTGSATNGASPYSFIYTSSDKYTRRTFLCDSSVLSSSPIIIWCTCMHCTGRPNFFRMNFNIVLFSNVWHSVKGCQLIAATLYMKINSVTVTWKEDWAGCCNWLYTMAFQPSHGILPHYHTTILPHYHTITLLKSPLLTNTMHITTL